MKIKLLITALFLSLFSFAQEVRNKIKIEGIPKPLEWVIEPEAFCFDEDILEITAGAKTNMFSTHDGKHKTNNIPKLLFEPDSDFQFSFKVKVGFNKMWDAGILMVYTDDNYWAKFCFENEAPGKNRIVSIVNNETSDNANSYFVENEFVYLKLIKKGSSMRFLYSENGHDWEIIRYFTLRTVNPIKIGFASQSPRGESCTSVFSEISYISKD